MLLVLNMKTVFRPPWYVFAATDELISSRARGHARFCGIAHGVTERSCLTSDDGKRRRSRCTTPNPGNRRPAHPSHHGEAREEVAD
jgi:hypothetical protein